MLRSWKKLKTIKNSIKQLRGMQGHNIGDDYSCGIYNGIELCMAVKRTVASGIIRRGGKQ